MSLYFQATLTHVWYPLGQTPIVRVSPQRDHLHFYGALNLLSGQQLSLSLPALCADNTVHFLDHLRACLPDRPLLILLDRAPWHTAATVQSWLANQPAFELFFFPTACPDLNPQEHVWKHARQAISHNHTFPTFPALCQAFRHFLDTTLFSFDWLAHRLPPILRHLNFG